MNEYTISFRPIGQSNWREAIELQVSDSQREYLWPNAHSLVEAAYEPQQDMRPFGIYRDETMVGLIVFGRDTSDMNGVYLYHFMIDRRYQRMGLGQQAMLQFIELARTQANYDRIALSYHPENESARAFYARMGFSEAGIDPLWNEMRATLEFPQN